MGRPKNILSDTDFADGRDNRFGNSVLIGRVSEINCDKVSTNVRVIMPDKVDHENNPLITKPVPVMQQASTAKKSFAVPRVGTNVIMIKMPNGTSNYLVLGGFYTTSDPPPVDDPMLDHTTYDDGSVMQFDASNGQLDWNLKGDYNWAGEKDYNIKNKGKVAVTPDGDVNIKPKGKVLIEASQITLKGHVIVQGAMDQTGNHTDSRGLHSSGREAELEARIVKLEEIVGQLVQRVFYGS